MYVRGLSTRDIEDLFCKVTGGQMISKSAVSELSQVWEADFQRWRNRCLAELEPLYFFLDAFYLPLRSGTNEREGILAAYAILRSGKKVLIHLALGGRENYDSWLAFLPDLTERGFKEPALVISDGNPGLKKALRQIGLPVKHQRCQRHKLLNILVKLPKVMQAEMKRLVQQVFWADSYEEGLSKGRASIGRLPSEQAALKLVYAVASTYARNWRGMVVTAEQLEQIDRVVAQGTPLSDKRVAVAVG